MTIKLNDQNIEVEEGISLADLINHLGLKQQGIAVAIDYQVVPREAWSQTLLYDQMTLMLIQAVSGG